MIINGVAELIFDGIEDLNSSISKGEIWLDSIISIQIIKAEYTDRSYHVFYKKAIKFKGE